MARPINPMYSYPPYPIPDTTPTPVINPSNVYPSGSTPKFAYQVVFIAISWVMIGIAYLYSRWRQRSRAVYIIPRVFVLCSPRTVQFHYELILRVGLPSFDFNPDKHDIDITVQGSHRNEVVPMTRLNTKTLIDEPLITSLSIIVYRLVELPALGSLILRHSGHQRAWLFIYDFTVIDLSSNKEQYYTINRYINSLNRIYLLEESTNNTEVHYPIDDVPLPQWSLEDVYTIVFTTVNWIILAISLLTLSCPLDVKNSVVSTFLAAISGAALVFFLVWLMYYNMRWGQDRREYFNLNGAGCCPCETWFRFAIFGVSMVLGLGGGALVLNLTSWSETLPWIFSVTGASALAGGLWALACRLDLTDKFVDLGLKFKGIESVGVGMRHSELATSNVQIKSTSTSDEEDKSTMAKMTSKFSGIGPRSSVKTFGFDAKKPHASTSHTHPNPQSHSHQQQHLTAHSLPVTIPLTGASADQRKSSRSGSKRGRNHVT